MATSGAILLFVLVAVLVISLFRRWQFLAALLEEINHFGGGPGTPMHPSPADDGTLLRRRSRTVTEV